MAKFSPIWSPCCRATQGAKVSITTVAVDSDERVDGPVAFHERRRVGNDVENAEK